MTASYPRYWRSAEDALAALRREPGLTRAGLGRRLGLGSGPTSDLVKRLVAVDLMTERPAAAEGRGRPTTTVHASSTGPAAVVLDLRHGDWRLGTCGVDGVVELTATGTHAGRRPDELLAALRPRIETQAGDLGDRLVGVGVVAPGTVAGNRLAHATMRGWRDVDMSRLAPQPDIPLVVANDATASAIAEARLHAPRPRSLVHVVVEIGVGGALILDGVPAASSRGLQGEFGHLPFGDPTARCHCGARGCWSIGFDVEQVAAAVGQAVPAEPRQWLQQLFTDTNPGPSASRVRRGLAVELGRGVAGLVNAMDPDLVTLGGLAAELRAANAEGFDEALLDGLMRVQRERPPRVVTARGGENAPLVGVGLSVFDRVLDAQLLAQWSDRRRVPA